LRGWPRPVRATCSPSPLLSAWKDWPIPLRRSCSSPTCLRSPRVCGQPICSNDVALRTSWKLACGRLWLRDRTNGFPGFLHRHVADRHSGRAACLVRLAQSSDSSAIVMRLSAVKVAAIRTTLCGSRMTPGGSPRRGALALGDHGWRGASLRWLQFGCPHRNPSHPGRPVAI
jgi:hypothetical protein